MARFVNPSRQTFPYPELGLQKLTNSLQENSRNWKGEMLKRRGMMLILSSPSGAGKTSISRAIMQQDKNIKLSVSVTTRARRANEVDGIDYHFRTVDEFEQLCAGGKMLEWAEVHGNLYGTPKAQIDAQLEAGTDVLFDIDYQGARKLHETCADDIVGVFVLPPSITELKRRLEHRADDSTESMVRRLQTAREELGHWESYDYVIINNDLDESCRFVSEIISAARNNRKRQVNLHRFISTLEKEINSFV